MNNNSKKSTYNIGIIGFGRFGQFIGEKMSKNGFNVYATSRSDYTDIANKIGITFVKNNFIKLQNNLDIIVLAPSVLSFEQILISYPTSFWDKKLIVDVLSVKVYPKDVINKYLSDVDCDVLLTHPMFGPDSAKLSWENKSFVYWKEKIQNNSIYSNNIIQTFLLFWENQGCKMIEMEPHTHDKLTANSQFLTHFIGRLLELLNCQPSEVDTDGYKSLLDIKNNTTNDSWDLFFALAKYNSESLETIKKIKTQFQILEDKLETIYTHHQ